jgi:hypothetical protein
MATTPAPPPIKFPPEGKPFPLRRLQRSGRQRFGAPVDPVAKAVHWTPDPIEAGVRVGSHFFRLTGPDGLPGNPSPSSVDVWAAPIDAGTGKPDLTNLGRVSQMGTAMLPAPGDWVFTNENGDIKLWSIGPGGVFGTPVDLTDGPQGNTGPAAGAQGEHTHELIAPQGIPTYANVRDNYVGVTYSVGSSTDQTGTVAVIGP